MNTRLSATYKVIVFLRYSGPLTRKGIERPLRKEKITSSPGRL